MEHIIESLQMGYLTAQEILVHRAPSERADAVWHTFALACATRVLDREQEAGRSPHPTLRAAIAAKREWLASGGALREDQDALRQQQTAVLQVADRFGETVLAFLRRNWKQIDGLETLRQINATSRLLAMGPRAVAVAGSMSAATVALALSPNAPKAAGLAAAAAIHYAVFFEQLQQSPFASGASTGGLFLGPPPTMSGNPSNEMNTDRALHRIASIEEAWQSEQIVSLLQAQRHAIHSLYPLLQQRQQQLNALTDNWQHQLEDALF